MNFEIHPEPPDEFRNSCSDGQVKKSAGTQNPFLSGGMRIPFRMNFEIHAEPPDEFRNSCRGSRRISKFMPRLRMNFEIHAEALDEFRNSSSDGQVKKSAGTKYPFLSGGIRIPNFRI